ncbi:oligogalacturonate-specific porin KdgM family protein [Vibrio hannami]|uniref:oligogalacturonate-specific porin KdgM family protein n=1 Tax=Vibrio hannami TaxID=2717094 RepID=UPI00240EDBDF|nr:oligogalacturonate-specific porin KdgM family protein [Vibrio hannami]MDG3086310.1 oligogalacturonate-specific porin KdgM family protein [Vibrio hannami]
MMKKTILAALVAVAASSVSAASLDFRQEYKHDTEDYASRVKIGSSVGNHYFGVEAKQKGKPFSEWEAGDNEFEYGYRFNINEQFTLIPSMPVTFGGDSVTYKPQIRAQYKFDSGITAKLRYRHEFRNFNSDSGKDDIDRSKFTANLDYNWDNFQFGFEANYEDNLTNFLGDWYENSSTDHGWDYNLKIGYKEADWAWRPYVEFGNVSSSGDDNRQLRSRVGITYSF